MWWRRVAMTARSRSCRRADGDADGARGVASGDGGCVGARGADPARPKRRGARADDTAAGAGGCGAGTGGFGRGAAIPVDVQRGDGRRDSAAGGADSRGGKAVVWARVVCGDRGVCVRSVRASGRDGKRRWDGARRAAADGGDGEHAFVRRDDAAHGGSAGGRRRARPVYVRGGWDRLPTGRGARIEIATEWPLPVQTDGEYIGTTRVSMWVEPGALTALIAPQPNVLFSRG